jgi:hypothetical protein
MRGTMKFERSYQNRRACVSPTARHRINLDYDSPISAYSENHQNDSSGSAPSGLRATAFFLFSDRKAGGNSAWRSIMIP